MKTLRYLCFLGALCCALSPAIAQEGPPAEPTPAFDVAFEAVDATHFTSTRSEAVGAHVLAITAEGYTCQLIAADGHLLNRGAVFGVNVESPSEANAATDIRAAIAATIPAE